MSGRKALPNQTKSPVRSRQAVNQSMSTTALEAVDAALDARLTTAEADIVALEAVDASLGTAAFEDIGTSGANVPLMSTANTWSANQQFQGQVQVVKGNATTAQDWVTLVPTDYGTGNPGLFVAKSATATDWNIALWDGTGSTGTINITAGNLKHNYLDVLDVGDIGTSGATIPLLNTTNTWSAGQIFVGNISIGAGYTAGCLAYTDANWGMLNRPAIAGAIAAHRWDNAAGSSMMQLTEAGVLTTNSVIQAGTNSVSSPGFNFSSDSNSGMYNPAADKLGFATGGVERVRIGSSTAQTLEVLGQVNLTTALGTTRSKLDWGITQTGLTISNEDNTPLYLRTTATNRVAIQATGEVDFGTATKQSSGLARVRRNGDNIEFGHTNTAGYGSALGAEVGSGAPFLSFNCMAGTTNNTYKTVGLKGSVIRSDNAGGLIFGTVSTASADNQSLTTSATLSTAGALTLTGPLYASVGSAAAPGLSFSGDTNTGIWWNSADSFHFSTGGTNRASIASYGAVVSYTPYVGAMATSTAYLGGFEQQGQGGAAMMQFHRPAAFAAYLGLDSDNRLKWGGWSEGANAYPIAQMRGSGAVSGNITWGTAAPGTLAVGEIYLRYT